MSADKRTVWIEPPITPRRLAEAIGIKVGESVFQLLILTGKAYPPDTEIRFEEASDVAAAKNVTLRLRES